MLAKLQPPSILEQDNEIMSSVTQILDKVMTNIQMVADYVCEITTKLDDVRDIIKEYDIEIAENLQEIIKEHMLTGSVYNIIICFIGIKDDKIDKAKCLNFVVVYSNNQPSV